MTGERIVKKSVLAYALFGLVFGGSVPHYFYQIMERSFHQDMKFRKMYQFILERLIYAPLYQALSLYFLSRFEMNSHHVTVGYLEELYWPLLKANWQYLSLAVFLNTYYVHPMFRAITMSLISFIWIVYIAHRRRGFQGNQGCSDKPK